MNKKKNMFKKIGIYILRILIIIMFLNILYNLQFEGRDENVNKLNDFLILGINTPFIKNILNQEIQLKLDYFKIILTTSIIFITYLYTIKVMNNLVNGLSSIIRNKSNNLLQYKLRILNFVKSYLVFDVLTLIFGIMSIIFIKNIQNMWTLEIWIILIKIIIFYIVIPMGVILIMPRIEFFISFIASMTIISIILIYQMNIVEFIVSLVIYMITIIVIILYTERLK